MWRSELENKTHFQPSTGLVAVILITSLAIFSISIFIPSKVLSSPSFQYETTLKLNTGAVGETRPVSVTVDPIQGEVCITDERQASLHILNNSDIELFKTSSIAQLSYPADGCIDQQGRLVCVDRDTSGVFTICRLNVYGEPDQFLCEKPGNDWIPNHLVITRDGNYLTLDSMNALLAKHDSQNGQLIWQRTIAIAEGEDLHLGRPAEAPNGQLYIPGGNLRKILVLENNGILNTSFGEFGSAQGYFSLPVAAAFTPQGALMILDRMRHKIMIFQPQYVLDSATAEEKYEHRFVSEFGSMGAGPGQFYHPVAIASDAGGRVYVTQGFQGRVQVFRYTEDEPE